MLLTSTNYFIRIIPITKIANAGNITSDSDQSTYLTLKLVNESPPQPQPPPLYPKYRLEPIINWYDFQDMDNRSVLNSKIDVNQEYKFCISITSDQGWKDIEYINISAWFDNGEDSTTYNQSKGGNINMFLQYENTSGNPKYSMLWPKDEATLGSFTEKKEKIKNLNTQNSECYNLTFSFIPGYQFRYAPGDGNWDDTKNSINDIWSWNFEISVTDGGEGTYKATTSSIFDEFGVNSYTEIISVGMPSLNGLPGENVSDISSLSIKTRSNIDYSISVDLDDLVHEHNPSAKILKDTMWVRGGNLIDFMNFDNSSPIFFYGSLINYKKADDNDTMKITNNIDYKCNVPIGQIPGNYYTTVRYKINAKI